MAAWTDHLANLVVVVNSRKWQIYPWPVKGFWMLKVLYRGAWTGCWKKTMGTRTNGVSFGPHLFSDLDFADDVITLLANLLELRHTCT